jgi:hypothetical protein
MAFGLDDLINNVQGSIDGLIADVTGKNNDRAIPSYYQGDAAYKAIQSQLTTSNWMTLNYPYTFSVIDIVNSDNPVLAFGDFALPLAPQNINQSEEPAINITPTQGGTTVNHGGNRYKNLSIAGTTGIAPFRGAGGVNRKTGEAIAQPKQLKYKSGYEVFLHFRNWLRTYYEAKKKMGKTARNYRLIFKNYKDGEFLIVELLKFEMDRQAARSFLYDYKCEFKVLGHFKFDTPNASFLENLENNVQDAFDKIDQARGVFLRTQDILRQVESTYEAVVVDPLRKIALAIKALQGIGIVAADMSNKAISDTVSAAKTLSIALGIQNLQSANAVTGTLDPRLAAIKLPSDLTASIAAQGSGLIQTFGEGLMALDPNVFPPETIAVTVDEQNIVVDSPRSFYEDTIAGLERVKQNAEDFFNLPSTSYDQIFGRTATNLGDPTSSVTNDQYDLLYAFNNSITGVYLLLSTVDLFKATYAEKIADMNTRFNNNIQLIANQAVKQIKMPDGMSLERLAQQELGDATRWGEIVEVNNLKAPYLWLGDVSQQPEGTIKPSDNILIPVPVLNGFSQIPAGKQNKLTTGMSTLEQSLGCDLKIGGDFDLQLTSSGDLEIIAGAQNMGQAVVIKLSYEPGELLLYPQIGAGLLPGIKQPTVTDIRDAIVNTLLQDNRIQRIENLGLKQEGDDIRVSFDLKIKQVDIPIPVSVKI